MLDVGGSSPQSNTVKYPGTQLPVAVTLRTAATAALGTTSPTSMDTMRPAPSIPEAPPRSGSRVSRTRCGTSGSKPDGSAGAPTGAGAGSSEPVNALATRQRPIEGTESSAALMKLANPTAPGRVR